jgi:hypothetical protein
MILNASLLGVRNSFRNQLSPMKDSISDKYEILAKEYVWIQPDGREEKGKQTRLRVED